ncbi:MAG: hypothetical protein JWM22_956, partial [Frankiales bacterium]|nr:hypothetical protein [Frankiales bacterium]
WDLHTVIRPSSMTIAVCPDPGAT